MSLGGSKGKVDTADSIEARRIAIEEFNDRMRFGAPAEKLFMEQVDRMRTPGQYERAAGLASSAMQPELAAAQQQRMTDVIQRGIAPTSGAFTSPALEKGLARSRALGTAESQDTQTNRYFTGQQNVVGIGRGVATTAIKGFGDLADISGRRAVGEAQAAYEKSAATGNLAGGLAGVGAGLYANYNLPSLSGRGVG